jgi:activator of 2-hydroxyglutaryl-CoA dehydratase
MALSRAGLPINDINRGVAGAVITGGVAKNSGMFSALERALGVKMHRVENPQINGALGAALIAMDALELSKKN